MTPPDKPYVRREPDNRLVWVGASAQNRVPRIPHKAPAWWPDERYVSKDAALALLEENGF